MDQLQKANGRALGWFPTKQFEGYVEMGGVLIAERRKDEGGRRKPEGELGASSFILPPSSFPTSPLGYVISKDRYAGRDDLGAVFQVAVTEGARRRQVGATLVREALARAAYGCRLFCCWCAQDLSANRFWESLGFVPIAFRTGGRGKMGKGVPRTHVLWQRRVREGDDPHPHPYWYPFQTKGGALREERLVFPIMPGTTWDEAKPVVLPPEAQKPAELVAAERKLLDDRREASKAKRAGKKAVPPAPAVAMMPMFKGGKIVMVPRATPVGKVAPTASAIVPARAPASSPEIVEKPKREARRALKHEKAALAFCRELRDRWAERVAEEPWMLEPKAKYAVGVGQRCDKAARLALPAPNRALPAAA